MPGTDTKKSEVKENREFCDDRYVSWKWTIAGMSAAILIVASLAWGLSQWGAKVDAKIGDFDTFKIEYETEIHALHQTVHENHANLDSLKSWTRPRR
jgi:hypothetical protein